MEQICCKPEGPYDCLADAFDYIVGTSVGGVLAVCVGIARMNASQIVDFISSRLSAVFSHSERPLQGFARFVGQGAKHDESNFDRMSQELFDQLSMIDASAYMGGKCATAVVASVNPAGVPPAIPFLIRNYEYPPNVIPSRYQGTSSLPVWQAIRATSAAPTYFQPVVLSDSQILTDGALVANNPSCIALHEISKLFPDRPLTALVSIGTGSPPIGNASLSSFTPLVLNNLIHSATATEAVAFLLQDVLSKKSYFRLQPELPPQFGTSASMIHVLKSLLSSNVSQRGSWRAKRASNLY